MITEFRGQYRWLSNFWPATVTWWKHVYPTVEHAYQAAKTVNEEDRRRIAEAPTAAAAKQIGKTVTQRPDWEEVKVAVMAQLLVQKFAAGGQLAQKLLDTGDQEIVEGNNWGDTFWGVCRGKGQNNLGKLLMKIREDLKKKG